MKLQRIARLLTLFLILRLAGGSVMAQGTPVIDRWVIGGGGGIASGGNVLISSTLGQAVANPSGVRYTDICVGYWCEGLILENHISLPLALNSYRYCDPYEPNDNRYLNPWGPLRSGNVYEARLCQGDEDNYYFEVAGSGGIQVQLTLPPSLVRHTALWVYHENNLDHTICGVGPINVSPYVVSCPNVGNGQYIVRLYTDGAFTWEVYGLRVTFPD